MRKFYTLLFLAFFTLTGTLQARNLDQAVERAVTTRAAQAKTRPADSKTQKKPSQNIQTWENLPIISWQQYEQLSQQEVKKQEKLVELNSQLQSIYMEEGLREEDAEIEAQQGLPVYEKAVKDFSYIYIGEYHNTPVVQQEIRNLLKAIRKANPGKKILLATEFLQRPHSLVHPLHKDGQPWLITEGLSEYNIPALADELHVDTLALDDDIVQIAGSVSLLKTGSHYIKVSLASNPKARSLIAPFKEEIKDYSRLLQEDPVGTTLSHLLQPNQIENYITQLFKRDELKDERGIIFQQDLALAYGPDNVKFVEAVYALGDTKLPPLTPQQASTVVSATYLLNSIQASTWGILQRNYQWAERIKQAEKNYDIVVVWGGQGHFDDNFRSPSVPLLLNHRNSVLFDFTPIDLLEATDETSLQGEIKREDKLLQQKLETCAQVEVDPEKAVQFFGSCQWFNAVDFEQTHFIHVISKKTAAEELATYSPQQKALAAKIQQLEPNANNDAYKAYYAVNLR